MSEHPFGHEAPTVAVRYVLGVLGALALAVVIALIVLHVVVRDGVLSDHAQVVDRAGAVPSAPRLQPHPDADIARERAQKKRMLSGYAWNDARHHTARIPIERAMQLYVKQQQARHRASASGAEGQGGAK